MLLNALKEYADNVPQEAKTPPLYAMQRVLYVVELEEDGRFLGLVNTATGTKGPEARGVALLVPTLPVARTVGIKANLLRDNAEYALGVIREGGNPAKVRQRHAAFVEAVRSCALATGAPEVQAVVAYLERLAAAPFAPSADFRADADITFRVGLTFPMQLPAVQAYWAQLHGAGEVSDDDEGSVEGRVMACLLCGKVRPVLRRMPFNFKNVPGGQTSGCALISANANAFESYGLTESQIAPLCQPCAEGSHKGLRALRSSEQTHLRRDPVEFVFWARDGGYSPMSLLETAEPTEVLDLLKATDTAHVGAVHQIKEERFYAISLAGSGGRLAIRDWLDVTVGEAKANLARFYKLQFIVPRSPSDEVRPLPPWRLAGTTVRDPKKDKSSPAIMRALYRTALAGGPVPLDALFAAVRRFRADQTVTTGRAALVKLVLLSQPDSSWKEDQLVSLNREERDVAYVCGRLLAVLEQVQRQALGDVNATVVDRYYGSASSTPIAVFGRLVRGAQPHLAKLRRDKHGSYVHLQREMGEVMDLLPEKNGKPEYPRSLSLRQQGVFSIGFYHQRSAQFLPRATGDVSEPASSVA